MEIKVALLLLLVAILLILLAYTHSGGPDRADLIELPVEWPHGEENLPYWCGSGTKTASAEAVLISCGGDCYALLRYWVWFPADVEMRKEVPVELRMGDELLLRRNVTLYKGIGNMYIQTPVILIRIPEGGSVKVADSSLEIPACSREKPALPHVIFTRGSFERWEEPLKGFRYIRLMRGLYAATWNGTAELSCNAHSIPLRELRRGEIAIISVEGCNLEVEAGKVHFP